MEEVLQQRIHQQLLLLRKEIQQHSGQQVASNISLGAFSRHKAPGSSETCNQASLLDSLLTLQGRNLRPSALYQKPSQHSGSPSTAGSFPHNQHAVAGTISIEKLMNSIVESAIHPKVSGQHTQSQRYNPDEPIQQQQQHWQLADEQLQQRQESQGENLSLLKGLLDTLTTTWKSTHATNERQQVLAAAVCAPPSNTSPAARSGLLPLLGSAQPPGAGRWNQPDQQALSAAARPLQLLSNKDLATLGAAVVTAVDAPAAAAAAAAAAGATASAGVIPYTPVSAAAAAAAAGPDMDGRHRLSLSQVSSGTAVEAPISQPHSSFTTAHMLQTLLGQIIQLPPLSAVIKAEQAAAAALQARDSEQAAPEGSPTGTAAEASVTRLGSGLLEGVLGQTAAGLSGSSQIPLQATLPEPEGSEGINISNLTAVLEAVVAIKKQASACIQEAFRLGLLPLGTAQPDLPGHGATAKPQASALAEDAAVLARTGSTDKAAAVSAPCGSGSWRVGINRHTQKRSRQMYEDSNQPFPREHAQSSLCTAEDATAADAVKTPALAALAAAAAVAAAAEHSELLPNSDQAANAVGRAQRQCVGQVLGQAVPPRKQQCVGSGSESNAAVIAVDAAAVSGRDDDCDHMPQLAGAEAAADASCVALNLLDSNVSYAESCGGEQLALAAGGDSSHQNNTLDIKQLLASRAAAVLTGQQDAGCTARSAASEALNLAATRALFERVLAVMSRSQALSKQLAMMVIPCANAARGLRQQNRGLSVQAQQASQAATRASTSLRHEQDNAAHLKQQLEVAKVALNMKQRRLAKLQEDQQAATVAQAAQLQKVGQAVNRLMEVVNGQSVQLADKQRLMAITTDILQALL